MREQFATTSSTHPTNTQPTKQTSKKLKKKLPDARAPKPTRRKQRLVLANTLDALAVEGALDLLLGLAVGVEVGRVGAGGG